MADCRAINNQINNEWLIHDQGAIVRQMGWDPKRYAADPIERESRPVTCAQPLIPLECGAVQTEYASGVTRHSHGSVDAFWMRLRTSLPNAALQIDRCGRPR